MSNNDSSLFPNHKAKIWRIKATLPAVQDDRTQAIIELLLQNRGLRLPTEQEIFFAPVHPEQLSLAKVGIPPQTVARVLKRLKRAWKQQEFIIVYGDYDADGVTATAILWETLHGLGFRTMPFLPHREKHGYGLKPEGIADAIASLGKPSLILTVDNGIVAFAGARYCQEQGIDLVICDHHEAVAAGPQTHSKNPPTSSKGEQPRVSIRSHRVSALAKRVYPDAFAILHSTETSGAGLAFLWAKEIRDSFEKASRGANRDLPDVSLGALAELAAIGVIADVMPLVGVNRSLAKHGLVSLASTQRLGLQAMLKEAGFTSHQPLTSYHVGFILAPRINATGRLDHSLDSLRLLCTLDAHRATHLAKTLSRTNKERQDLTQASLELALQSLKHPYEKKILIVNSDRYNPGVIGLVAGKLVDTYHRPAIAIARIEKVSKGSVRSVAGVDIIALLRQFEAEFLGLGGHPLAAGFSVATDRIDVLTQQLEAYAQASIPDQLLVPSLAVETELELADITVQLYERLQSFAPFGMANPNPVFVSRGVEVVDVRLVGKEGQHLKLQVRQERKKGKEPAHKLSRVEAIFFHADRWLDRLKVGGRIDIAYKIDLNAWNGTRALQLVLQDINYFKKR